MDFGRIKKKKVAEMLFVINTVQIAKTALKSIHKYSSYRSTDKQTNTHTYFSLLLIGRDLETFQSEHLLAIKIVIIRFFKLFFLSFIGHRKTYVLSRRSKNYIFHI